MFDFMVYNVYYFYAVFRSDLFPVDLDIKFDFSRIFPHDIWVFPMPLTIAFSTNLVQIRLT